MDAAVPRAPRIADRALRLAALRALRPSPALVGFFACSVAVWSVSAVIASNLGRLGHADLVAVGVALDLTIVVPLLYYVLLVRRRAWPVVTLIPVFVLGVALARWLLPPSHEGALLAIGWLAAAAEIILASIVVRKSLRLGREYRERVRCGLDVPDALRAAARSILGDVPGSILAYELAVFHYALFGWKRASSPSSRSFPYHRSSAYPAIVLALVLVTAVETFVVHLLIRQLSPAAAWTLSSLGAYAVLWLVGDLHAARLRPIRLAGDALEVRLGLRWAVDVPLDAIVSISPVAAPPARRGRGYLGAVLLGSPNRRIELDREVEARGPYGLARRVRTIDLRLDEPVRLDEQLGRSPIS